MPHWSVLFVIMLLTVAFAHGAARAGDSSLTVHSLRNLQVVQRKTKDAGHVLISGSVNGGKDAADEVAVRVSGESADGKDLPDTWQPVAFNPAVGKAFNQRVKVPAGGWY